MQANDIKKGIVWGELSWHSKTGDLGVSDSLYPYSMKGNH